jgi:hypothetical protein
MTALSMTYSVMSSRMPSISDFITTHADQDRPCAGPFEVENRATLQVNLRNTVHAMVAYRGDMTFLRNATLEDAASAILKSPVANEGAKRRCHSM